MFDLCLPICLFNFVAAAAVRLTVLRLAVAADHDVLVYAVAGDPSEHHPQNYNIAPRVENIARSTFHRTASYASL